LIRASNLQGLPPVKSAVDQTPEETFENQHFGNLNISKASLWNSEMQKSALLGAVQTYCKHTEAVSSQIMISCSIGIPPRQFWENSVVKAAHSLIGTLSGAVTWLLYASYRR
jgi:hypothetical protein